MGTQEWLLLGVVLLVPLLIAIGVTLWTLEQALKRNRKNRPDRAARRVSEPVADTVVVSSSGTTGQSARERDDPPASTAPSAEATPTSESGATGDVGSSGAASGGESGSSGESGGSND